MDGSAEIDALVNSSRDMMMMTKHGENNLDNMLSRAHRVAARISSMYKYEKVLQDMQSLTVNGNRRKLILNDLQRENKQIMALQDENRQLRETTEEYLTTMRDILESHAELEATILLRREHHEIDDIDNIIFEMANTELENSLKEKALKMAEMMDDLEKVRKEENRELALAVQRNKNYKELFKMACFSSPAAANVLRAAMAAIREQTNVNDSEEKENGHEVEIPKASDVPAAPEVQNDAPEVSEESVDLDETIIRLN
ncbi:unnamed protein product [Caenorhabditis sp. 36 PRJEB53466]|nr:unnamed protein product [Caenorhabditis sp. 36 PRJEB53466]